MIDAFQWVIHTYGQTLTCHQQDGTVTGTGLAIVQPMTEADWKYTAGVLGSDRTDKFLCLAQPDLPLGDLGTGGWVAWGGENFEVMTVRPIWVAGQVTHLWIALRPARETAP